MKWKCAEASFIFFASLKPLIFLLIGIKQTNQKDFTSFSGNIWKRKSMILPNSNVMELIAGSTIKFSQDFLTQLERLIGEAIFENTTFGKAAITLQTPIGVELLFDQAPHKKFRFTANFDLREDLDKVLEASTKFNAIFLREKNSNIYFI